ncbi:MAG: aspartate/glutamate racemase family protein [SAR202 cluster bacterium]|nr:aspartate/glutamate racemase family protein [SAR202 cluster bacterium]
MTDLIYYSADHGADAVGLACSVYAPVVKSARELVPVPVVSYYGPVMAEAARRGRRIAIIASLPATMRDAEYYLHEAAQEARVEVELVRCMVEELFQVIRTKGEQGLRDLLAKEVTRLASGVDAVLLAQFSMAPAVAYLQSVSPVPVLSAPHSSAIHLKKLVSPQTGA